MTTERSPSDAITPSLTGLKYLELRWYLRAGFDAGLESGGFCWDLRDLWRGGYLGIGIGGEGLAVLTVGSVGGGFEGKEEKRLAPGSAATITMEVF